MQCPYCTSDINDAAVVCPVCTRDLYLIKPLLDKIAGLEEKIEQSAALSAPALEARVAELEAEIADLRNNRAVAAEMKRLQKPFWLGATIAFAVGLVLLLIAHGLIVMIYDLKPILLRVASTIHPLPPCQRGFPVSWNRPSRIPHRSHETRLSRTHPHRARV